MTKKFDHKLKEAMKQKWDKDIDMNLVMKSELKENKKLKENFTERIDEIQSYIGANIYYNRDIQDENYRYNNLRTKLIDKRKRKEAREAIEGF